MQDVLHPVCIHLTALCGCPCSSAKHRNLLMVSRPVYHWLAVQILPMPYYTACQPV